MPVEHPDPIILVLGADANYARPMAVTLYSALSNLDSDYFVEVHIISNGIATSQKQKIETIVAKSSEGDVKWHETDNVLDDLPITNPAINVSGYIPFLIPYFLPDDYEKSLYLDSDLLVEDDISTLWNHDSNTALRSVQDFWIPYVSSKNGLYNYKDLGLSKYHPYFNSGVLLINLEAWRRKSVREESLRYLLENYGNIVHADQEVLNAILSQDWSPLDPKWNVHHAIRTEGWEKASYTWPDRPFKKHLRSERNALLNEPGILHFAGPDKPWKHPHEHPEGLRWFRYLWNSGWLTKTERLRSMTHFYARRATKTLRIRSRPYRHQLAGHLPRSLQRLLRRHAD